MEKLKLSIIVSVICLSLLLVSSITLAQKSQIVLGGHSEVEINYGGTKIGEWAALVQEFMKQNPNIDVKYQEVATGGREMADVITTMLRAQGDAYDIYPCDIFWPYTFLPREWLFPIDEAFPKEERSDYVPAMIESFTSGDHIYGVPYMNDYRVLFYRTDILQDAGMQPPDTWDDLIEICKKLQKPPDLFGYAADWQLHQDCEWEEMMWSNGGQVFTDKEVTVNSPQSVEALQYMVDMYKKHQITEPGATVTSIEEARQIFTEGKAIFHQNWLYVYPVSQSEGSKVIGKVGIARLPRFKKDSPEEVYSTLGGWTWVVNPYSKDTKASLELVKWLAKKDTEKWITQNWVNVVPARLSIYQDADILKKYPWYETLGKLTPYTRQRFPNENVLQFLDGARNGIIKALEGEMEPQAVLDKLAQDVSGLLDLPIATY